MTTEPPAESWPPPQVPPATQPWIPPGPQQWAPPGPQQWAPPGPQQWAPPPWQPPSGQALTPAPAIRTGIAIAAALLTLPAGIVGLISMHMAAAGSPFTIAEAANYLLYVIPITVGLISVFPGRQRWLMLGALEGICWLALASLGWDVLSGTLGHFYTMAEGQFGTAAKMWTGADTALVVTAVLVRIACQPGVKESGPRTRRYPAELVAGIVVSEVLVAACILTQQAAGWVWAACAILVAAGGVIAHYGARISDSRRGGALLAGFAAMSMAYGAGFTPYFLATAKISTVLTEVIAMLLLTVMLIISVVRAATSRPVPVPGPA